MTVSNYSIIPHYQCGIIRQCELFPRETTATVWVRLWLTAHRNCTSLYKETGLISPSARWDSAQLRRSPCRLCGTRQPTVNIKTARNSVAQNRSKCPNPWRKTHEATGRKRMQREFFLPSLSSAFLSPYGSHLSGGGLSDINNRLWKNSRREGDASLLSSWGTASPEAWCPS